MAHPRIEEFIAHSPGQFYNPDNAYGFQCKDLADAYAEFLFGVPWAKSLGPANAKDAFRVAPSEFWDKYPEKPGDAGWLPIRGDLVIYGGDALNPFGHIGVCVIPRAAEMDFLQMDGFLQRSAWIGRLGYNQAGTGPVIGWLRPKASKLPKVQAAAAAGPKVATRTITADVAAVMTAPTPHASISKAYPHGLKRGAKIAVLGYVQGVDPVADGVQDDAWFKTISGLYVWANAAGNSLAGLRKL